MAPTDGVSGSAATSLYLVERYWPGVSVPALRGAIAAVELAVERTGASGRRVRHVRTTLVVSDETIFSVFEADSMESVQIANDGAAWPYDRILEVLELP